MPQLLPREGRDQVSVGGEVSRVLRSDGGEDAEGEVAVVLAEELIEGGDEVGFDQTAEGG